MGFEGRTGHNPDPHDRARRRRGAQAQPQRGDRPIRPSWKDDSTLGCLRRQTALCAAGAPRQGYQLRFLVGWKTGGPFGRGREHHDLDVASGKLVRSLPCHVGDSSVTALSANGKWYAYGDQRGTIRVLDWKSGAEVRTFEGLTTPVQHLEFSPNESRLFGCVGTGGAEARMWDVETGQESWTIMLGELYVQRLRFSSDGKWLALACLGEMQSGQVRILDARKREETASSRHHRPYPGLGHSPRWQPSGNRKFGWKRKSLGPRHPSGNPDFERARRLRNRSLLYFERPTADKHRDGPDRACLGRHAGAGRASNGFGHAGARASDTGIGSPQIRENIRAKLAGGVGRYAMIE